MNKQLSGVVGAILVCLAPSVVARPLVALTVSNQLLHFDSASPSNITQTVSIFGLQTGDQLEGIDFRPKNGVLYGIATNPQNGSVGVPDSSRIYAINPQTGAATLVGYAFYNNIGPSVNLSHGFDFDPTSDRVRVVNETDDNDDVSPDTGGDNLGGQDLSYSDATNEIITAIAHDRNDNSAATASTLFGIDFQNDRLVRIGGVNGSPSPFNGAVTTVGPLGLVTSSRNIAFDISEEGTAYAAIATQSPQVFRLYTINLSTGAATVVGNIGSGSTALRGLAAPFSAPPAQSFAVTNATAVGANSLREVIARANATLGANTITFNLAGAPPHVLQPSNGMDLPELPPILDTALMDGTSEPDFNPETRIPVVAIHGAGQSVSFLRISGDFANGSTIAGLRLTGHVIDTFTPFGAISIDADNATIIGNYIGTDGSNDTASLRNTKGISVLSNSTGTRIGGTSVADRNVIARNTDANIRIEGFAVQVLGNFIGTTAAGAEFLPFIGGTGVDIRGSNTDNAVAIGGTALGAGNLLAGCNHCVSISSSRLNSVQGNLIGTDVTGTKMIGIAFGVAMGSSRLNTIGGTTAAARNVIAGFGELGIGLFNGSSDNVIQGNYIGTDITGEVALLNPSIVGSGISCNPASDNQIGGEAAGAGNLLAGARLSGVVLRGGSQGNRVLRNLIGVTPTGKPLGNGEHGVRIEAGAIENVIGAPGAGNVIAFNTGAGVSIVDEASDLNQVRGNSIYSNGGLGIDLKNDGVTANDALDADTGPNQTQNYPVLTSAKTSVDGTTTVQGSLSAAPNTNVLIDFYTSDAADPSGNGEGRTLLGTTSLTTDANGSVTFSETFPAVAGQVLSATATAVVLTVGHTSEFSPAIAIVGPKPAQLANISTRLRVETGERVLIGGLIITGMAPKKVILRAIGPSLDVNGKLADPQMEVYGTDGQLIGANNNWRENANQQEIIDSTVPPPNDLEAAFLASLAPGAYTAVVSGVDGSTGVGLVEAYDLDQAANSKLANIATRGFVQTGDDVLIGGLIITGETQLKLLLRAIGPSLSIDGKLADPTLELVNGNGDPVAFNNNWKDSQQQEIEATTIPPADDLESAIVATLPPAAYTAVVRGVDETSGVALVEVYALQ